MRVSVAASGLRDLKARDLVIRFLVGGAITAGAGALAQAGGPSVGGLFLAVPAILPASLTLIASHQEQRKARAGGCGRRRGRTAAALDALGASMGAVGLLAFGLLIEWRAPHGRPLVDLMAASLVWAVVGFALWMARTHRARPIARRAAS